MTVLETRKAEHLAAMLRVHVLPPEIFEIESYKSIRSLSVDGMTVHVNTPSLGGRGPTKKTVAELRCVVDAFSPTEADTFYAYHCDSGYGRVEGWLKLSEFLTSDRHALTREELLPKQRELAEKYAPREGYKACDYCGTQRPIQDLKPYTIISRQYPNFKKVGMYCPETGCGGHDQMAHEG